MEHTISIVERTLSDGSAVYDVVFGDVLLPAITMTHAYDLADAIEAAVREHTNETVKIVG